MTPAAEARIRQTIAELGDALVEALRDVQPADVPEKLLSVSQAAEMLGGVARSTLYGQLQAGRLRSVRVGSRRLIPSSAVAELIRDG